MEGVELARFTRCFTPEDVIGKASDPGMGTDMSMNFMRQMLADQKYYFRDEPRETVTSTCSLCQRDLQDECSRLLPCQHLLCKDCFHGLIQDLGHVAKAPGTVLDELISCPGCKRVYLTRDVTEHFFLQHFPPVQLNMARNCSECKEKRAAHILCTYCNRWLCSSCTEEHRHGPAPGGPIFSRAQKGSSGVNGGSGDFALYCPLHTQEVLKLFCETCDVLTCHSCLMVEHKEHRCRHVEEVLQNQRMLLESVTTQVAHKKSSLQTSAKQIEDRIFEVKHQHRKVENQIKMAKMVLMNELNKQANGLIEELEGITNERKRKLEQQLQSIMVLNRQFEHVQNFINWAVCSKTSVPFLFSKELIVFQMQRLLETSCNTDPGSPWSIRFTWEPNFWTKQLASLGCITTEGGQLSRTDTTAYGGLQGPPSFYQSHQSPVAQQEALSHPSHKFQPPALCSSSVCCSHCSPVSSSLKSQVPPPSTHPAHSFRQPSEMMPHQLGSLQCPTVLPREKELACSPHPPKLMQPWLETQPSAEQESTPQRSGQHLTSQPVCIVPPQDIQQAAHAQSPLQAPSIQVQFGHHQKLKLSHFQQQPQQQLPPPPPPPPPPPQQPPPPLPPSQHLASSQHENPPGPACSQNVDIMHHKFELEEMQKDLELLLQAQQPSLQLSQTKSPQHLQQTIVGQINYIVRQPAPVQSQSQEDTLQVTDEPPTSEGPKPALPLDKTTTSLPQTTEEETPQSVPTMDNNIQHSSPNVVRKHSTSVSIMGFSNTLEMELSSTRLARTLEPQIHSVSSLTSGPPQAVPSLLSGPPQTVSNFSSVQNHTMPSLTTTHLQSIPNLVRGTYQSMPNLMSDSSQAITSLASDHCQGGPSLMSGHTQAVQSLATCPLQNIPSVSDIQLESRSSSSPGSGQTSESLCSRDGADVSVGNTLCKMESEDSTRFIDSLGQGPKAPSLALPKNLAISSELEEPINLSVKKLPVAQVVSTSTALQQYQHPKEHENFEQGSLELDTKENQSIRTCSSEPKIPYVRLERLKICAASSGEMPVFKLKPQKNDQDGSFLLVIECGTESSSMSIKVSQNNLPDAIQAPGLGGRKVTVTSLAGQRPPEVEGASPEEQRLIPRTPGGKKGPPAPIENEDFCAVCLNGGELLCCDRCPKVYHLSCHVPALLSFPGGDWVCTLCRSLTQPEMEYDCENARYNQPGVRALPGLSIYDQKKCEKLVLSLCCNSLSLPFHEPVSPLARHYYQIIKRPMDLSIIRRKLQKKEPAHYTTPEEVVSDVRLMFWNCAKFNYPDSEVAEAGRCLEVFFEGWLKEIYPEKLFAQPRQEDSDSEEVSNGNGCSISQGFPWPPYMQEGIQPKRRRRHMENEKAKKMSFRMANSISQV
ncbi:tripartite motif-containing protein 66 isoform X1 [Perognathus longimembris pacificus]|uniref:tripartite motif-containing protein 66 isoform X1 n=1 Tax=Perognathus longimembris pacificus TaxID=214514 RepID=UPI002019F090|nr:tripartite motif-containing protein 66 isoform X1 [Perognathus longimembris pacificus]XP_048216521.1 tripartite motif-containing protein 66 isoform X1 [Perognathus longimembris pacificus]XP_048216522.1 tripartite motif-containing protein 66 isoform X1 [Perognathus longimembris pacificus]